MPIFAIKTDRPMHAVVLVTPFLVPHQDPSSSNANHRWHSFPHSGASGPLSVRLRLDSVIKQSPLVNPDVPIEVPSSPTGTRSVKRSWRSCGSSDATSS